MKLRINGDWMEIKEGLNLSGLLKDMQIAPRGVAVELNKQVLSPKEPWENIMLKEGDMLEIVHAVAGG